MSSSSTRRRARSIRRRSRSGPRCGPTGRRRGRPGPRAAAFGAPRGAPGLGRLPGRRPRRRPSICSAAAVTRLDGRPPSGEAAGCLASLANFTMYAGQYREAVRDRRASDRGRAMPSAHRVARWRRWARWARGRPGRRLRARPRRSPGRAGDGEGAGRARPDRHGLPRARQHALRLRRARGVGRRRPRGVGVGSGPADPRASARWPSRPLVPLGRWREAEAILADVPPGWEEGTGAHLERTVRRDHRGPGRPRWTRPRRSSGIRRDAAALVTDAAFAGNLAGRADRARAGEGRLGRRPGARRREPRLAGRRRTTCGSGRAGAPARRAGRGGDRPDRAGRDAIDEGEEAAESSASPGSSDSASSWRPSTTATSPVFAEARGNRALAEAEATRLLDQPDPAAWDGAAERFIAPRRPYELARCRYRAGGGDARDPRATGRGSRCPGRGTDRSPERSAPARSSTRSRGLGADRPARVAVNRVRASAGAGPGRESPDHGGRRRGRGSVRPDALASARSSACSSRVRRTDGSPRRCSSARARPASTSRTSSASSA